MGGCLCGCYGCGWFVVVGGCVVMVMSGILVRVSLRGSFIVLNNFLRLLRVVFRFLLYFFTIENVPPNEKTN